MREILLNPGPVNLSERVRQALLKPDLCHREPEFAAMQQSIRRQLLRIYDLPEQDWAAILITGSGTSAMEAMLTSCIPARGKVLVIENGVYGERLSRIAAIHGMDHACLRHEWGGVIDVGRLERCLSEDPGFTHVAVVHHETTSGRLNRLETIAEVCARFRVNMLVDGVSSFGAEELRFEDWGMHACAATANKCLHGIPGTSFAIVKRAALRRTEDIQRTLYLDLNTYLRQQDQNGTPFTQSVQSFYALDEALREHAEDGGWQTRRADYWRKMDSVRHGLADLKIEALLPREDSSCVLNAFRLPNNLGYASLHDGLKQRGFVIYAGQGEFAKTLFRISVMGSITMTDMERFLEAVRGLL
jgi:2-aminoethylphosphonate-pyruvate transaminase